MKAKQAAAIRKIASVIVAVAQFCAPWTIVAKAALVIKAITGSDGKGK